MAFHTYPHVVAAIYHQKQELLDYVNAFYKKATMLKACAYEHVSLADLKEWPKTSLRLIAPPLSKQQPGRPKRLRRKDPDELAPPNDTKLYKYNVVIYCTKCKQHVATRVLKLHINPLKTFRS